MITEFLKKLLKHTNIHGTEQTTESSRTISKIIWLMVVIGLAAFSIFQIYGLTKDFVEGKTTFTNENVDVSNWHDLSEHLRISYCSPDWLDEYMMTEQNASALGLLIAMQSWKSINLDSFMLLQDLLTPEEAGLVSYEIKNHEKTRLDIVYVSINLTIAESEQFLNREMAKNRVTSPGNLIRKFSKRDSNETEFVFREGLVCQVMKRMLAGNVRHNVETFYDVTSFIPMNNHNMTSPFFSVPYFQLYFEPVQIDKDINHPLLSLFAFQSNKLIEDNEVATKSIAVILYTADIRIRKFHYLSRPTRTCRKRVNEMFKKSTLIFNCEVGCHFNPNMDYSSDVGELEQFLQNTHFPDTMTFADSSSRNETSVSFGNDAIRICQERCEKWESSCDQVDVKVMDVQKTIVQSVHYEDGVWRRMRALEIKVDSFWISQERKILTFDSYVGAVGGSLGVCLGASLVSLFQLGINVLTCYHFKTTTQKVEDEASKKFSGHC